MSRYGIEVYGATSYGAPQTGSAIDAGLTALCTDYGVINLTWAAPDSGWTLMQLARSTHGYPAHPADGTILVDLSAASGTQFYTDTDVTSGRRYYYTLFLFQSSIQEWTRAGTATALAVIDYLNRDSLWERLPQIYRGVSATTPDSAPNSSLYRFLSVFGFTLDTFRTEISGLLDLNDTSATPAFALPALLTQLGFTAEPELGPRAERLLADNAPGLYNTKGTIRAAENLASIITGWDTYLRLIRNRMLDAADAFIALSAGRWNTASPNCTLTNRASNNAIATLYGDAYAILTANATGQVSVSVASNGRIARMHGIPVVQGRHYTASVHARGGANLRVVIDWYDRRGYYIESTIGAPQAIQPDTWIRLYATGTAARGAMYAGTRLIADHMALNDELYLNAAQFEDGSELTPWQKPRAVYLVAHSDLVNEIDNPDGTTGTQGWVTNSALSSGPDGFTYTWGN